MPMYKAHFGILIFKRVTGSLKFSKINFIKGYIWYFKITGTKRHSCVRDPKASVQKFALQTFMN